MGNDPNTTPLLRTVVRVRGMDCGDEVSAIHRSFEGLDGVIDIEANIIAATVAVRHEPGVTRSEVEKRIRSAGVAVDASDSQGQRQRISPASILTFLSGAAIGAGFLLPYLGFTNESTRWLFVASVVTGAVPIVPKALRSLRDRRLDMNLLMCVAAAGAMAIGEYSEGAAVVFLFALAESLERFSLARARDAIRSLLTLVPDTTTLETDDGVKNVPTSRVAVGSVFRVPTGARIPLDGVVLEGSSSVNQAPLTGESLPVDKKPSDTVLAGSINGEGSLRVRSTQEAKDTKLAQIIQLVENAEKQKAPTQRFVDRFAKIYTPAVLLVALLVVAIPPLVFNGEASLWLYRGLVLLVIACPCALVIATPVSIVSGLTSMARRGVLIKGGAGLEAVGRLRALAVDKTGTITEGAPRVREVVAWGARSAEESLAIAAAIDSNSTHPLARAVVAEAKARRLALPRTDGYQARTGLGAEAEIDGHLFFVGNHRFAHETALCSADLEQALAATESKALSVVVVGHRPHLGCKGEIFGILGLGDSVRAEAKDAIGALHQAGIERVVMLSGDNQRTVDAIAKQVGIDEAHGDLLPTDKVLRLRDLKDRYPDVAMIGDGVNDAPAMATASVGIAMGATGTDTAIEASDMTLMRDDLRAVAEAVRMGRRTLSIIRFNTAFALGTKLLFLGLSVAGFSSLWLAIAADTGATLLVIANALRLLAGAPTGKSA